MDVKYASGSAVSITKGMNGFELEMGNSHLQQMIHCILLIVVQKFDKIVQLMLNDRKPSG